MNILYVYGLAGPQAVRWPDQAPPLGLSLAPVNFLRLNDTLTAICSVMDESRISDDRLLDPVAAAEAALAHHSVLEWAHSLGTIIPFGFGCAFRSEADLRNSLLAEARLWADRLQILDGCEEVEIRLSIDLDELRARALDEKLSRLGSGLSAGRRYLIERAVERELADLEAQATQEAWALWSRQFSLATSEGELRDVRASGIRSNQAHVCLIKRSSQALVKIAEKTSEFEPGIRFEISRPWPPYSFSAAMPVALRQGNHLATQEQPTPSQSFASLGGN